MGTGSLSLTFHRDLYGFFLLLFYAIQSFTFHFHIVQAYRMNDSYYKALASVTMRFSDGEREGRKEGS